MTEAAVFFDELYAWLSLLVLWIGLLVGGGVAVMVVRSFMIWWGSR